MLLNDFTQPQRYIEAQVFFHQAGRSNRARVVPAMPRINHDPADLEPQCTRQGMLPVERQFRSGSRTHLFRLIVARFGSAR